jgi:diaminopimelate epimerase
MGIRFAKGHGTENDFVLLPDEDGLLGLTPALVRSLCDRRAGVGGDGVLRVVRSVSAGEDVKAGDAEWFMDYRNADGSVAEMCGNGIRVYARYLLEHGLATGPAVSIATRGGTRRVVVEGDLFTVDMGEATPPRARAVPLVTVGSRHWTATGVLVPNPHAVVFVDDLAEAGPLTEAPDVSPGVFPDGVNVEFVVDRGPGHVAMRVHERGVGETRSCGTGACAVAWAWRRRHGQPPSPGRVQVDVPGGTVWVTEGDDGHLTLTGPAVLVAEGELSDAWWQAAG